MKRNLSVPTKNKRTVGIVLIGLALLVGAYLLDGYLTSDAISLRFSGWTSPSTVSVVNASPRPIRLICNRC